MHVNDLPLLNPKETFCFACHPDVPCYNACCRNLDLLLSPYDILRLRRRLGIDSTELLSRYAEHVTLPDSGFPAARLRMLNDDERRCPFVAAEGCSVYLDRPAACRIYPLGRGIAVDEAGASVEHFVMVREPHCRGFEESNSWTAAAWATSQDLSPYHTLDDLWMRLITRTVELHGPLSHDHHQLAALAAYQSDRFREKLVTSGALQQLPISEGRKAEVIEDDEAFLRLAFEWLERAFSRCSAS